MSANSARYAYRKQRRPHHKSKMEWPPDVLSVVRELVLAAIRPGLKRRLWGDLHFELVARFRPGAFCDCEGEGCFDCDEGCRPHGGPVEMYEDIQGCLVCDPEFGWGRPTDCPDHFHWLTDVFDP